MSWQDHFDRLLKAMVKGESPTAEKRAHKSHEQKQPEHNSNRKRSGDS